MLESSLCSISKHKVAWIITGDINIDLCKYESHAATTECIDMLLVNNFLPVTSRVRPPNGGRRPLHRRAAPVAAQTRRAAPVPDRCTDAPRHVVGCYLSPPIAGERVGVEGWGGNGHLLEAYSCTEPTCKPQSTMCSFWDLRRYAVAVAVAVGHGKLKNVR